MSNAISSTAAVVLAAGKGTRMKSAMAKALFPLCGQPLAVYPLHAARAAGIERVVLVVGHQADAVKAAVGPQAEYALQEPQHGTGHALMCAEEALRDFTGILYLQPVDAPLIPSTLISELMAFHREHGNAATLLSVRLADPIHYGRVVRAPDGQVTRIVEARDASPAELAIHEINSSAYCFEAPLVFEMLREITPNNAQGEYYLTDVIERLNAHGHKVGAMTIDDEGVAVGINNRVELAEAEGRLRQRIRERHMLNGVTLIDPASTFIDEDVAIGQDTIIYPFTIVAAGTRIGENCNIGAYSQLYAATLEDGVQVISSWVERSVIRTGARVGPFSRLRPGCDIASGAYIGNFSELKNTHVGANSAVHHVGYLGDTTLGERVNIGAGTITCNFDGVAKHPTTIGDGAFIGSNSIIVAPITIGNGALTGAGSVVTHDIPAGKVAFGVPARLVREREEQE